MHITNQDGTLRLFAGRYSLICPSDRPFVYVHDIEGRRLADLFVYSGVNTLSGPDDTTAPGAWVVDERPGEVVLEISVPSSIWERKTYRFHCLPERFWYEIEVEGEGLLWDVDYFGGYYSGQQRWGSGFVWSGQRFRQGFSPEPYEDERIYFSPAENTSIDLQGVPLPGKGGWFFTPAPFCYAFQTPGAWLGVGVEARPGANQFNEYAYHGRDGSFYLSLAYEGHTRVRRRYLLPGIGFDLAQDPYAALEAHVRVLYDRGFACDSPPGPRPAWWSEPIFCGWGAQNGAANLEKQQAASAAGLKRLSGEAARPYSPAAYSRQERYDGFLDDLARRGVDPGIVVLDDKWQLTYGDNQVDPQKWPDLPGFIQAQHARGRKVLLWLKAWDPEGLPPEECICNQSGQALAVDPTHPAYEQRLRASVRRMLAAGEYGADGFKIDFTARIPSGPGLILHGQEWGLELMRRYLSIIYTEARLVKPDALIMTHTPHPYLAEVVDMIRLNDMNIRTDINRAMRHRARVASLACPGAIIDTDNWPVTDRAAWRKYMKIQAGLGVPSLYYTTHIDMTLEPLEERDYRLIRRTWEGHRQRAAAARSGGQALLRPWPQVLRERLQAWFGWLRRPPKDGLRNFRLDSFLNGRGG